MATERLHMGDGERYHAYEATAHVVRYALARESCAGRRVLDIACGEGYGSALLAAWGAREVIGIDISADAIESAKRNFAQPAIRFLSGDAVHANCLPSDEPPFDLIISFETIEHLADPETFLHTLRRLRAPGGSIMISCPNDPAAQVPGAENPFHLRAYTFEQFRASAEDILGRADLWLIETPVVGSMHYVVGDARNEVAAVSPADIVRIHELPSVWQVPAQEGAAPSAQDCLAYVGIWGQTIKPTSAVAPLSYSGFMYPWRQLDGLQAEIGRLNRERQDDRAQLLNYANAISALRGEVPSRREGWLADIASRDQRIRHLSAEVATLNADLASVREERNVAEYWRRQMEASRFYRLLQAYRGLYDVPIIGPALGSARRLAGRLLRGSGQT